MLATAALERITLAFAHRAPPATLTDSLQLSDAEHREVMAFSGLRREEVEFALLERCPDAVFWFSPEAFCYYLPGIMACGPREGRWDSGAYDALIGCLDRSPEPAWWDDFFAPRWTALDRAELEAVAAWVDWLEAVQPEAFHANTYPRVRETLRLLAEQARES
jgi:hypothetical protein